MFSKSMGISDFLVYLRCLCSTLSILFLLPMAEQMYVFFGVHLSVCQSILYIHITLTIIVLWYASDHNVFTATFYQVLCYVRNVRIWSIHVYNTFCLTHHKILTIRNLFSMTPGIVFRGRWNHLCYPFLSWRFFSWLSSLHRDLWSPKQSATLACVGKQSTPSTYNII